MSNLCYISKLHLAKNVSLLKFSLEDLAFREEKVMHHLPGSSGQRPNSNNRISNNGGSTGDNIKGVRIIEHLKY